MKNAATEESGTVETVKRPASKPVSDVSPASRAGRNGASASADASWTDRMSEEFSRLGEEFSKAFSKDNDQLKPGLIIGGLLVALLYAYWNTLSDTSAFWRDDQYSHGWLIPIFSVVVLWLWRKPIGAVSNAERWAGAGVICLALALRVLAAVFHANTPGMGTFPFAVLGVFMMVGGFHTLRWAAAPILFLIFMFPLPMVGEEALLKPLNKVAVGASTYTLQTLGVGCYRDGNQIIIDELDEPLAVIDQCSGLRMVTIFFALAVGYAMVVPMNWWERSVIVLSAIPIAIFVNLTRIVVTGLLYLAAEYTDLITKEMAQKVFHDLAGWLMMPAALGLLFLLRWFLAKLVIEEAIAAPVPVRVQTAPRVGSLIRK